MSKFKVAFFDIDDTLYDHFKGEYPPAGVEAIKEMVRRGIKVFPCSARPYGSQRDFGVFDLGIDWSGFIASSGGAGVVGKKIIHADVINKRDVYAIIRKCKELGLTAEISTPFDRFMISPANEYSDNYHSVFRDETKVVRDYHGEKVIGILLFAPEEYDQQIHSVAPDLIMFRFETHGVELMSAIHSKGNTITKVLDYLGVSKEEVISFGDNLQDIPMAEASGCFVCMGNGRDEVKAVANYVTDSVSDNGLANAINKLVLGAEE